MEKFKLQNLVHYGNLVAAIILGFSGTFFLIRNLFNSGITLAPQPLFMLLLALVMFTSFRTRHDGMQTYLLLVAVAYGFFGIMIYLR